MGQIVYSDPVDVEPGLFRYTIDLNHLTNGLYNIAVVNDSNKFQKPLIILK